MSKRDRIEKEKKVLREKAWVKNNPIFTEDHILDFYEMFQLYADPRTKRADVRDILVTAKTLDLDQKHIIIHKALEKLAQSYDKHIDFDTFVQDLTKALGNPFDQQGREQLFNTIDIEEKQTLAADDIKLISKDLHFNLTDQEVVDVIHNVGGYEATEITLDKFEKYLARKVQKRQLDTQIKFYRKNKKYQKKIQSLSLCYLIIFQISSNTFIFVY
ncbi:hypothetical protein pb186bvf_004596 [Paramecium bursaria]